MQVRDLMFQGVRTCRPNDNLATAAIEMLKEDCGILPVLQDGRLRGVITDRDISIAVATQHRTAEEIQVGQVMTGKHYTCRPDEDVATALERMAQHQVRRLPVVGHDGELDGLISINDIVLESKSRATKSGAPTHHQVMRALKVICRHRDLPAVGA